MRCSAASWPDTTSPAWAMTVVIPSCPHEANERLKVTVLREPQLGKRGLYPTLSTKQTDAQVRDMMNLITYCDGSRTLLGIAEKINVPMWDLIPIVKTLKDQNVLETIE